VWVHEYLEDFPGKQDVLRYVLTANMPENKDNDFTWKDFQAKNNNELADILGNLSNRVFVLTQKYFDGKVPARGNAGAHEAALEAEVQSYPEKIGNHIRNFHFRDALNELINLARAGNKYLTETEPWKLIKQDKDATATVIHFSQQLLANLAILAEPFLPQTAIRLRTALGIKDLAWKTAGKMDLLQEGHEVTNPGILFDKIEDEAIEKQVAKLHEGRLEPLAPVPPIEESKPEMIESEPIKEEITFDDFTMMDIRVATVLEAEKLPKTDKLLKLKVDLGAEQRTVVSGIAGSFAPEEVKGRQVLLIANLAPRNIKGITSHGMILMAEKEGRLVFVQPAEIVHPGSIVK
jgi:methionyl-tRNA synthetase